MNEDIHRINRYLVEEKLAIQELIYWRAIFPEESFIVGSRVGCLNYKTSQTPNETKSIVLSIKENEKCQVILEQSIHRFSRLGCSLEIVITPFTGQVTFQRITQLVS